MPAFRVGAVSYLNSVPLIWGMQHGAQSPLVDLSFSIPSVCAQQMRAGQLDLGLLPVAEIARQELTIVPDVGISCFGAVRSILLFSRVPWRQVRTLAADSSSRTSVELAKVILRERYGAQPDIHPEPPQLATMLSHSEAALVIGDPALKIEPEGQPHSWLDLGSEWLHLTGLPMVFAAWAGRSSSQLHGLREITRASYEFGHLNLQQIVDEQPQRRGISRDLARSYLHDNIRFEIGADERRGLEAFLELAQLAKTAVAG